MRYCNSVYAENKQTKNLVDQRSIKKRWTGEVKR